jgi:hypothetical protein
METLGNLCGETAMNKRVFAVAATVLACVVLSLAAGQFLSTGSVGDTVQADYLNLDAPTAQPADQGDVQTGQDVEVVQDWVETARRPPVSEF